MIDKGQPIKLVHRYIRSESAAIQTMKTKNKGIKESQSLDYNADCRKHSNSQTI